jgi:hypothetical protein
LENGKQRGSKNRKFVRLNLEIFKNKIGYTQNLPKSSKIVKICDLFPWNI